MQRGGLALRVADPLFDFKRLLIEREGAGGIALLCVNARQIVLDRRKFYRVIRRTRLPRLLIMRLGGLRLAKRFFRSCQLMKQPAVAVCRVQRRLTKLLRLSKTANLKPSVCYCSRQLRGPRRVAALHGEPVNFQCPRFCRPFGFF